MRILICNNFVRNGSGIDTIVRTEMDCLKRAGHEVDLFSRDNSKFDKVGHIQRLRLAGSALYGFSVARELDALLSEKAFDIVHVHNTVPLLTGAVYDSVRRHSEVTLIQSLHNYRAACLYSYFYRAGKQCHLCQRFGHLACVLNRCYGASFSHSAALAVARGLDAIKGHRFGMVADHYIAVSDYVRAKHIEIGIPARDISVLKNAVPDLNVRKEKAKQKLVYIGAAIEAKGVRLLPGLARTLPDYEIHVVGAGHLAAWLGEQSATLPNLRVHGFLRGDERRRVWQDALFTLVPSLWEEPFGLTAVESFSLGIPVITTGNGALKDIITHHQNGFIMPFDQPDSVAAQIRRTQSDSASYAALCLAARQAFNHSYSHTVYTAGLEKLFHECRCAQRPDMNSQ